MMPGSSHSEAGPVLDSGFAADLFAGSSLPVERLKLQVERMAPHFRTLLITGERGTGKRTLAQTIHRLSPVAACAFVCAPCADLHAHRNQHAAAVYFLSGLDELAMTEQPRFLEGLHGLGRGSRVMVACRADPRGLVAAGRLSPEVYARIATLEIRVPALRERLDDLPHLLARLTAMDWCDEARERLQGHGWPANLRELREFCEHAQQTGAPDWSRLQAAAPITDPQNLRLDEVMQRHVLEVLQRCAGNKLKAAELLGISRSTLYRMLDAGAN